MLNVWKIQTPEKKKPSLPPNVIIYILWCFIVLYIYKLRVFLRSKDKTKKKIKKNSIMIFLWTMIKRSPTLDFRRKQNVSYASQNCSKECNRINFSSHNTKAAIIWTWKRINNKYTRHYFIISLTYKGQLISEWLLDILNFLKRPTKIWWISVLESRYWLDWKNKGLFIF